MYIDFAIAIILVICIIRGDKRGFVRSFINTFGWLFALGGAFLFYSNFLTVLDDRTTLRRDISAKLLETVKLHLMQQTSGVPDTSNLPGSVASALTQTAERAVADQAQAIVDPLIDVLMFIIAFSILFLILKLILFVIERILMRFTDDGPFSALNSIGGMIFNLIKGIIISYLILMIVIMVAAVGNIDFLTQQVSDSIIIGFLSAYGLTPYPDNIIELLSKAASS